jgi:hypothetical protein
MLVAKKIELDETYVGVMLKVHAAVLFHLSRLTMPRKQ